MKRVILLSPFFSSTKAGLAKNIAYAAAAMRDSLSRGEAPIAFHLLYPMHEILDDNSSEDRERGFAAAWSWFASAEGVVVYRDRGMSRGMSQDMRQAIELGLEIDQRYLRPRGTTLEVVR